MAAKKKVSERVISALVGTDLNNPNPLELGLRLKNCSHKKIAWEQHSGELVKDFVFRISGNGSLERLPAVDFSGRKLTITYKKPKSKKGLKGGIDG